MRFDAVLTVLKIDGQKVFETLTAANAGRVRTLPSVALGTVDVFRFTIQEPDTGIWPFRRRGLLHLVVLESQHIELEVDASGNLETASRIFSGLRSLEAMGDDWFRGELDRLEDE